MHISTRKGLSFGLTSGIITTLGLMMGLYAGTHSRLVIIGGILTIAVADGISDAFGMHMAAQAEHDSKNQIREATYATLFSKLFFAGTFIIPVLMFELTTAVIISTIWGLFALGLLSYYLAHMEKKKPVKFITQHLLIAVVVIILTHIIGSKISVLFG